MQKLLLLHGALGSSSNFAALEQLLQSNFEVYSFNFEGHGGSVVPDSLSIPKFAAEVINFLELHSIETISIFGYSMGGYVGLYLARHYPERVEKLFTLATKLNWTIENATKESAMLNPEIIKEKVPKYAQSLSQLHQGNWENLMTKTAAMMLELGKNPAIPEADFSQITTPVLIAVGDKDVMVSIEESVNAYRQLINAQFLVMPKTSHPIDRVNLITLEYHIRNYFLE